MTKSKQEWEKEFLALLHDPSKDDVDLLDFIDETIEEERQRVVEMIESMKKDEEGYFPSIAPKWYNNALKDLQSKLGNTE